MQEPLSYFYNKFGFDLDLISEISWGERYIAVMLEAGEIGVCATLGEKFQLTNDELENLQIQNYHHRIFLNAYYNALLNYTGQDFLTGDLLDVVNFKEFSNIVMVGYFRPVVEKLQKLNINVDIFDLRDKQISLPIEQMNDYLQNSDAVIASATTVYNNTFTEICKNSKGNIYILGPSALMNNYLFEFSNVKAIFGSRFKRFDQKVLSTIANNLGTRHFLKFGQKVVLMSNNS
jgi:uncharacterized protein (DUF4213/DUF364 family)